MKKHNLLSYFSPKTQKKKLLDDKENQIVETDQDGESTENPIKFKPLIKRKALLEESESENSPEKQKKVSIQNSFFTTDSEYTGPLLDFSVFKPDRSDSLIVPKTEERSILEDEDKETNCYIHNGYKFLLPAYRRDKSGHLQTDSEFDPSTLQLPAGFLSSNSITPAMKQWWKIKIDNFDTVLFFKMGKFYELFHMDADIGVKELGLTYMKGKYAHAGFPETSFALHASALVEKGYKVARVEQVEKPSEVSLRLKESGGSTQDDKLVRRQLCNIISPGTRIFDSFDVNIASQTPLKVDSQNIGHGYLLSIVEEVETQTNGFHIGVTIVDCSLASFTLSEFHDDRSLSKLRTLLSRFTLPIAEVILGKGATSCLCNSKLKECVGSAKFEYVNTICDAKMVIKELDKNQYFLRDEQSKDKGKDFNLASWPPVLKELTDECLATSGSQLSLASLSPIIFKLKRHLIDYQIFSVSTFSRYIPHDSHQANTSSQIYMIIDDNALRNLDVVLNSEGYSGRYGTILSLVNHCATAKGRRLMIDLVCRPLFKTSEINQRLDSVDEILKICEGQISTHLKNLAEIPDLDRLLFRLSSVKALRTKRNHPQNLAVIFNETFFTKREVEDFLLTITGFEKAFLVFTELRSLNFQSSLLSELLLSNDSASVSEEFNSLSNIIDLLLHVKDTFDVEKAKDQGVIIPKYGCIPEYDETLETQSEIEEKFQTYLDELICNLGYKNIKYMNSDKSRYHIEIPANISSNQLPKDFELRSQRKGFKRYASPYCQELLNELLQVEDRQKSALRDVMVFLIERVLNHRAVLNNFLKKIAMIDCLIAFAYFSTGVITQKSVTRPKFVESSQPFIEIKQGYHPCLSTVKDVVCNDISLGGSHGRSETTMLITGPNMGGKSTLMRQVATTVILAHIGCYVPCSFCELTPVDRIFARLGASFDRPELGESTFYVELLEASTIVNNATHQSLVLFDELGRGTSTHDGIAIAYSILNYVTRKVKCLTLFSTHYHYIARDLCANPSLPVLMVYMKCHVSDENPNANEKGQINFLYKVEEGMCPKSYGFHVAKLAGLPQSIVDRGIRMAKTMERNSYINELIQAKKTSKQIDYLKLCSAISNL